ncbi:hypothetical protein [Algoriphagus jejuensis]
MKWFLRQIFLRRFDLFVLGFYFSTLVFLITSLPYYVDVKSHNLLLVEYLEAGFFPLPPGYYALIYLVDLLIRIKYPFVASSAIVLTFFFWWKYRLIYSWFRASLPEFRDTLVFSLVFSFLVVSPIYIPAIDGTLWYLGKFTQTIWHNSTLICVFPFCIILVKKTFNWLESKDVKDVFPILAFGLVILLIKPSFLFAYVPTLPFYLFLRERKISMSLILSFGIGIVFFLLILLEKHLIFNWDPMLAELYTEEEKSQVVLSPLKVWRHFSYEPVFDFISSFPLLILYLAFWQKRAFDSQLFCFSLILLFFALAIFLLFAETGYREFHGNFYWQIPIALLLCHLSIVLTVSREFLDSGRKYSGKVVVLFLIYLIQVVWGVGYWLRIFSDFIVS